MLSLRIKISDNSSQSLSSSSLLAIAEEVRSSIQGNILHGTDFNGLPLRPLQPSTIKQKHSSRPLIHTGTLLHSIFKRQLSPTEYEIYISSSRSQVASWLHFGTSKIKPLPFFGIHPEILWKY